MTKWIRRSVLLLVFAGVMFSTGGGLAQTAQPVATAAEIEATQMPMSLTELFKLGGPLMYPLALLSIAALAFIIYFFVVLRREQVAPQALRQDISAALAKGDLNDARRICTYKPCPLAAVTLAGLDYVQSATTSDPALLKDIMQGEGNRQAEAIQDQIHYLLDIAVISPMVGFLGTVTGMIIAFNSVALDLAKAKPMLLASGVSQALITTAAGLLIGIPAMFFWTHFRSRTSKLVSALETACDGVIVALLRRR